MVNIQMDNGSVISKEKIDKLAGFIIDKFAEEKMSVDEAMVILDNVRDLLGEFSLVQSYKFLSSMSCNE